MRSALLLFLCLLPFHSFATELALFVPRTDNIAWQAQIRFAQAAANDLGVTLHVYNAENSADKMLEQASHACERGVDGILFFNYQQIGEQILTINENCKIPSIIYNTGLNSSDFIPRTKYQYWIGEITPDDVKAGAVLAEQLLFQAQDKFDKINMLVLNGNMKELSAIERNKGLYQFVRHKPSVTVVAEAESNVTWSREEAKRHFKWFYNLYPQINMVWAASDGIALGARDAILELGLPTDSFYIGGVDWLPEAIKVIKNGEQYISTGGHFTEAGWGVVLLYDYLSGHDFIEQSTQFNSQFYSINGNNVDLFQSFIDDDWQRINFTKLSKQLQDDKLYNFSIKNLLDTYYQDTQALELTDAELAWLKQNKTLRLANDINLPPFEYIDSNSVYQGIAADYIKLIADRLGIELIANTQMSWSRVIEASKQRELDIFPALQISLEREQYLDFTEPYISFPLMIITNQDIPYVPNIEALDGMKVAAVQDYSSYNLIKQHHPNIQLVSQANVSDALEAVSSGRVDAFISNIATANYIMTRDGYTNIKVAGVTPYTIDLRIAVRNDWPMLSTLFQKSLDSLTETEKQNIYSRWISVRYEHGVDYNLVWKTVLISVSVLVLLGYWMRKLSKRNDRLSGEISKRKKAEKQLLQEKSRIEQLSITDPLTGLYNRRYYNEKMASEIPKAQQDNNWLSFAIIDIDDFKQYNDHYGHMNGDAQLIELSSVLQDHCQTPSDYCFRLGGEEFGLLFSGRTPKDAKKFVERIRLAVEARQIEHHYSRAADVLTASFGLVTTNNDQYNMEQLYEAADAALYEAKEGGRNQVITRELQ